MSRPGDGKQKERALRLPRRVWGNTGLGGGCKKIRDENVQGVPVFVRMGQKRYTVLQYLSEDDRRP
jgi:hypothetical protein